MAKLIKLVGMLMQTKVYLFWSNMNELQQSAAHTREEQTYPKTSTTKS